MARKSFKIKNNLTEALNDTVSAAKNNTGNLHIEAIPLGKIYLDPGNPRKLSLAKSDLELDIKRNDPLYKKKIEDKNSLQSLALSINERGVINPIVVYKEQANYVIIAGERRTLASIMSQKNDIPAKIWPYKPSPLEISLIQWAENMEREDLTLWERLSNIEKIVEVYAKINNKKVSDVTATELHKLIGCSLTHAANYIHLISASTEIRTAIKNNKLNNIVKAAIVSKAPGMIQGDLLKIAINGADVKRLRELIKKHESIGKRTAKGRPVSKINFGYIKNISLAKLIIGSVLKHNNLDDADFKSVDWNNAKEITRAFKILLTILEKNNLKTN